MSTITLTKKARVSIYLKEYFNTKRKFTKHIRRFGGPFILLISIYNYYYTTIEWVASLSGFTIVFGIYYTLKPFIISIVKPQLFLGYTFTIKLNTTSINLTENEATSTLEFSFFNSIKRWESFYALRTATNQVLHLPIEQLSTKEIEILNTHLN